jgi:hypothetical protein
LIVEEKIGGANVGIHFTSGGRMVPQCRGHEITEGMHPQYDRFNPKSEIEMAGLHQSVGHKRFGKISPDHRGYGFNFSKPFLLQHLDASQPFLFRISGSNNGHR